MKLAAERQIRLEGSVLSVKDMTYLVYVYECLTDILDEGGKAPEEWAKLLVGIK